MKQKKGFNFGFATPFVMIVIFSLSIYIIALGGLIDSGRKESYALEKKYIEKKEINKIIHQFVTDFQELKNIKDDCKNNHFINILIEKYGIYNVEIKDVSTGINFKFLKKEYFNDNKVRKLISDDTKNFQSEYGWINSKYADKEFLINLQEDFSVTSVDGLYPLVNSFPLYNVYNMSSEFIEILLRIFKVKGSKEKSLQLYNKINLSGTILKSEIQTLLGLSDSSPLIDFLGTKTTFWQVDMKINSNAVKIILAAIPDINENKIIKYDLIEKKIKRNIL